MAQLLLSKKFWSGLAEFFTRSPQEWGARYQRGVHDEAHASAIPWLCGTSYALLVTFSVVIITCNEEANLGRTLKSVEALVAGGNGEIIVVDSGSTDRTVDIAKSFGAKVFVEQWKGYAAQKNSAIKKASGDWILSLDADEELDAELTAVLNQGTDASGKPYAWRLGDSKEIRQLIAYRIPRRNLFLGKWMKHGGFWPDPKLRLFCRGSGQFENRAVHEDVRVDGQVGTLRGSLIHHSYPTLTDYIDHMNHYSSLGGGMVNASGPRSFSILDIVVRPWATFLYNYFFRLGLLDGREGLLLHLYHAVYVSWKYAKAWEMGRKHSK